jgi:hypothetical protein
MNPEVWPVGIRSAAATSALALMALVNSSVHAQSLPFIEGYTPVQQPTADVVQKVCVLLREGGTKPLDNGTPQERLFSSCRKMVQTANAITGVGPAGQSLGLTNDELRTRPLLPCK